MICYLGREGRAENGWYVVYGFLSAEGKKNNNSVLRFAVWLK